MKQITILLLIFILFSCTTVKKVDNITSATIIEEKKTPEVIKPKGFRYTVPEDMEESPKEAYSYRLRNFIIDKDKLFFESSRLISIRETPDLKEMSLTDFAKKDQAAASFERKLNYEKGWDAPGLSEKNIPHISYQFYYKNGNEIIYQRSVYISYNDIFYVVSLSSREKNVLLDSKNDSFWRSICVD
jgi:hypothetical protein